LFCCTVEVSCIVNLLYLNLKQLFVVSLTIIRVNLAIIGVEGPDAGATEGPDAGAAEGPDDEAAKGSDTGAAEGFDDKAVEDPDDGAAEGSNDKAVEDPDAGAAVRTIEEFTRWASIVHSLSNLH
jgi:hypothetical protein